MRVVITQPQLTLIRRIAVLHCLHRVPCRCSIMNNLLNLVYLHIISRLCFLELSCIPRGRCGIPYDMPHYSHEQTESVHNLYNSKHLNKSTESSIWAFHIGHYTLLITPIKWCFRIWMWWGSNGENVSEQSITAAKLGSAKLVNRWYLWLRDDSEHATSTLK